MNNVILIGFMGSGKTCVGRRLSYRLQRTMIDTDKQIEKQQGKTITEIFEEQGEPAFRDMETACLQEILETCHNQVISSGGGLPLREKNRELLGKIGCVVYLRVTADTVYQRLKDDTTRPLLQGPNPQEKIAALLSERVEIYQAAADVIVDVDEKNCVEITDEIEEAIKHYETISH
ncbi:MAG: shikimate kinase [Lachnospiraceae bacterium]|nr:shikimate kinase [Lachnospiraceae bacterium]